MNLFDSEFINQNLLPFDGTVYYNSSFIDNPSDISNLLLNEIDLVQDEIKIFGKHHIMNRKIAWISEQDYWYGGTLKKGKPWTKTLLSIKKQLENETGVKFNACLVNYYPSGEDGMGWHSDDELELKRNGTIASISLGAERPFKFKHNTTKQILSINLASGSLLLMKDEIQHFWKHMLPKTKKVKSPRVNLTFRQML